MDELLVMQPSMRQDQLLQVSEGEGTGLAGIQSAIGAYEVGADTACPPHTSVLAVVGVMLFGAARKQAVSVEVLAMPWAQLLLNQHISACTM